ncbi:hypothetical protein MTR_4g033470 [Medicago truncatula]|uniref:Uncharacterized protein n=1 Tax=Medicago truncatula TaxID=3880 RepID=A0A072UHV7_MEDTR|nr:hypothetical protein MTR_4g033470 [Medicago truncatula]
MASWTAREASDEVAHSRGEDLFTPGVNEFVDTKSQPSIEFDPTVEINSLKMPQIQIFAIMEQLKYWLQLDL